MHFWAAPLNDREIIELFQKIREMFPTAAGNIRPVLTTIPIAEIDSETCQRIKKNNGYSIAYFSLSYGSTNISYNRQVETPSALARIEINGSDPNNSKPNEIEFSLTALKKLGHPPPGGQKTPEDTGYASNYIKVEAALAGAVDQFSELQRTFHEKNEELRSSNAAEIENLKSEVAEERRLFSERMRNEREALETEILTKRQELDQAKKNLDDRSNTFVRRAIRLEIKDSIKESLSASLYSKNTAEKRRPVRIAYWIFISAAILFTAFSSYQISILPSLAAATGAILIIKATVGGFATIGLALLYLKWETTWINQQADFERILSATRTDIDRASWVVESLLEWNREAQAPMPNELLAALTRRLFDWDAKLEESQSPADSLASAILGSASNLKIGPNGAELDISNKGLKRLQADQ